MAAFGSDGPGGFFWNHGPEWLHGKTTAVAPSAHDRDLRAHNLQLRHYLERWIAEQERLVEGVLARSAKSTTGSKEPAPFSAKSAVVSSTHESIGVEGVHVQLKELDSPEHRQGPHLDLGEWDRIVKRAGVGLVASPEVGHSNATRAIDTGKGGGSWVSKLRAVAAFADKVEESVVEATRFLDIQVQVDKEKPSHIIVNSSPFLLLSTAVVILNAIYFCVATDFARVNRQAPSTSGLDVVELAFCTFYVLELALRLWAWRLRYFLCQAWAWNLFDALLVGFAVAEQVHVFVTSTTSKNYNVTYLRALRLLKLVKVLRIVRILRAFKELRIIAGTLLGSIRAMSWSLVLVVVFNFLASLVFTQAVASYLTDNPNEEPQPAFDKHFRSVGDTMISLYMSVTGGIDWADMAEPLKQLDGPYFVFYLMYTAVYMWVICNTLTSLFVETTMRNSLLDQQQVIQEQLDNKSKFSKVLEDWYGRLDDGSGKISYEAFCSHLQDPAMAYFAALLEIDPSSLKQFFFTLSANGTREVDLNTFVVGCIKLRGAAKSVDVVDLLYTVTAEVLGQKAFAEYCVQEFAWLRQSLGPNGIGLESSRIEGAAVVAPAGSRPSISSADANQEDGLPDADALPSNGADRESL